MAEVVNGGDHGRNCYVVVTYQVGSVPAFDQLVASTLHVEHLYPPCPAGTPAPPPVTPQSEVAAFLDRDPLPAPKPSVPPGFAITGKLAYLITGDTNHPAAWTRATILGPLLVRATAVVTVDWGDRTPVAGPYASSGAPYPLGRITHTFDVVGRYTVTVRQDWTVTWTLGGAHGVLRDLHTSGAIDGFEVRQIQAVVTG